MKLSEPRTAKNVYDKGDSANGIMSPSISEIRETDYLNVNEAVRFNESLIKQDEINNEISDFADFFKKFNS